jgi:hypothetical protein
VKSLIETPKEGERLIVGRTVLVSGKAWSGSGKVASVELKFGFESKWIKNELTASS